MTEGASTLLGDLRSLLCGLLLLACLSPVRAALLCDTGVAAVPVLDPLSASGELGAVTLDCSGGTAINPLPTVNLQAFYNVELLQDVAPILSDGTNKFAGIFSGTNVVTFLGIPFDPIAASFAIQRVFVDPSVQAEDFLYVAFLSVTGSIAVPVNNPTQVVALNGSVPVGSVSEPDIVLLAGIATLLLYGMSRIRSSRSRWFGELPGGGLKPQPRAG